MGIDQYIYSLVDDPRSAQKLSYIYHLHDHLQLHYLVSKEFFEPKQLPQEDWCEQIVEITHLISDIRDYHQAGSWPTEDFSYDLELEHIYTEAFLPIVEDYVATGHLIFYQCDFSSKG